MDANASENAGAVVERNMACVVPPPAMVLPLPYAVLKAVLSELPDSESVVKALLR